MNVSYVPEGASKKDLRLYFNKYALLSWNSLESARFLCRKYLIDRLVQI